MNLIWGRSDTELGSGIEPGFLPIEHLSHHVTLFSWGSDSELLVADQLWPGKIGTNFGKNRTLLKEADYLFNITWIQKTRVPSSTSWEDCLRNLGSQVELH